MTSKLTVKEATTAARKLMEIVKSGQQWTISTAEDCLPHGWDLIAEDSDFHPCTIKTFTAAYRANSKKWLRSGGRVQTI